MGEDDVTDCQCCVRFYSAIKESLEEVERCLENSIRDIWNETDNQETEMQISPELTLPMARETYLSYVSSHPRLKNSRYALYCVPDNRRDFKHFIGIVEKCAKLDIDPIAYVSEAMSKYLRGNPADVIARDLDNSDRIAEYAAAKAEADTDFAEQWLDLEQRLMWVVLPGLEGVDDAVTMYAAIEDELCGTRRDYASWFRVLYPDPLSDSVIETYSDAAVKQLMASAELRAFAARVRPDTYPKFMAKCGLQHFLSYDGADR